MKSNARNSTARSSLHARALLPGQYGVPTLTQPPCGVGVGVFSKSRSRWGCWPWGCKRPGRQLRRPREMHRPEKPSGDPTVEILNWAGRTAVVSTMERNMAAAGPIPAHGGASARRVARSVVVVLGKGCVDVDGNGVVVFGAKGVIEDERPHRARSSKSCRQMRITKHIYREQQPGHGKADFSETKHILHGI